MIKPDAAANPIALRWISNALKANSLRVTKGCWMVIDRQLAEELYSIHRNKFFFSRLIRHVCSGPTIAMKLESETQADAIKAWRSILGPSKLFANVYKEEGGAIGDANGFRSLRLLFSLSDTRNTGHGSDTLDELKREYRIFDHYLHDVKDADSELFRLDRSCTLN